jgi:hypothetical protein
MKNQKSFTTEYIEESKASAILVFAFLCVLRVLCGEEVGLLNE